MAGFVLIHGSWHGGWCFDPVAEILRADGHTVVAPDLPGMGGDEGTLRGVTLQGWADFALVHCRALKAQLPGEPIVLCGHSRGGIVLSRAAETDPAAMDALVYICAMMLPAQMSREQFRAMVASNAEFQAIISHFGDGAGSAVDSARGIPVFAQLSPPDLAEAAMRRLVSEPMAPLREPVGVTPERWGSLPRTYVECLQDRAIPIDNQRMMQDLSPGARTVTLDTDHSPFLSCPAELAAALIDAIPVTV